MDISSRQDGQVMIITVSGSMDAMTAPQLSEFFGSQTAAGHRHLVADLANLEYTSSAGLRALLGAVKDTRQHGGDLRLAAVRPAVNKVFELSGMNSIFKHYQTVEAAVASFGA
jgi:anti-sigma B factor antagonist